MKAQPARPSASGTKQVAFLRGINVGGAKIVKMEALKKAFEELGFREVKTLLASGNVAFASAPGPAAELARKIEEGLKKAFGHEVRVMLRPLEALQKVAAANPFKGIKVTPDTRLYVTFFDGKTRNAGLKIPYESPDGGFRIVKVAGGEIFSVVDAARGGHTLDAMAVLEKEFGKTITTRNWNTINKLLPGDG
jgi:uncharacterized protein (DUF1697 family)